MTKILIAESLYIEAFERAKKSSQIEFVYKPDISVHELESEIAGYDGLIVRPKQVTEQAIANAGNLKLIIRGGAGVNSIALDACKKHGIIVENTPALNSDATAEFTIALLIKLLANRHIEQSREKTRKGTAGIPENYMGRELKGKKIGIIGLGNIGQRIAKIATAFGMEVLCYARQRKELPFNQVQNPDELFSANCDVISLHIPLSAETNKIISTSAFAQMKKGTILLNTARPQLIDSAALKAALQEDIIAGFGIDGDYDLVEEFVKIGFAERAIITHHIADCTYEAQANIATQAIRQAIAFFENDEMINRVI
ncbi:MAG: hypothetical protein COV36_01600 [Alphaproteobacteria bacterium CG11_big_fil_rev_8_21_14_0_20_44_7]|nr:MAG: hypothetical protein COV36_01600 [Alphaproteobacteria bacterium CG11_big_fil_rev_8_21_14_0_20_44_7]